MKIIGFLKQAEKSADLKIAELKYAQPKIEMARFYYESKLDGSLMTTEGNVLYYGFIKNFLMT